ncbi:MAG: tol-pal system protein YbgF [Desulfobacteraceae bacterium]|nr:tol-pal system protein YbgF [Pseudomonadota bacterium]MBU4462972.1 tol-pal system protein YbgF [Pseudomonadota bacterium]MCG2755170.1 tol-pal system protein YbgF [Desulfobacteraceae bacterium]
MAAMKIIVLFIACLAVLCGCAMQQDVIALYDRMGVLEQRNVELEKEEARLKSLIQECIKKQEEKEHYHRTMSADMHVMLDGFREEIRILNGKLEETGYLLKRKIAVLEDVGAKSKDILGKVEERSALNYDCIVNIQQYLDLESPGSDSKTKAVDKTEKQLSEDEIYASAKQAFDHGDLEAAREEFQRIIKQYPKSQHADNAQFWIGEIYYRGKWYEKAILEYQKVIEKYPKGNKVPASLLKQGLAFLNLGEKANARLILNELVVKHPKSNEAKIAKQKLKGLN